MKGDDFMSDKTKDVLIRALKTFWQAAVAYLLADVTMLSAALTDFETGYRVIVTLVVGAVAAGLSAVYNGIIKPLLPKA
jgi:hypothetical protein